ncbi:MAG: hypothetical protein M3O31_05135, partial [Acidobacteriota bacterium]|nr:hypothetical protein [Acidobacteriota bacterium]
ALRVTGSKAFHAIAYLRGEDVVTIVPRLTRLRGDGWGPTTVKLPEGQWTNRLTGASMAGGKVSVGELLRDFPVALLVRE